MNKRNVLFLDQYADIGGGQIVLLDVLRFFLQKDYNVALAAPPAGDLQSRLKVIPKTQFIPLNVPLLSKGAKSLKDAQKLLFIFPRVQSLLKKFKGSLIYVNGPRLFPVMAALSLVQNFRAVYHIHLDHTSAQKLIIKSLLGLKNTEAILVNSDFTLKRLIEFDPIFENHPKVKLVINGMPTRFSHLPFRPPQNHGAELRVATVGRLSHEKGQDIIVNVAKKLPALKFFLLGGSDFGDATFAQELSKNLPPNVRLISQNKDTLEFLHENEITVLVVPSRAEESFGLLSIEGMAASCYTVVSEKGALKTIAEKTGARTFQSEEDLFKILTELMSKEKQDLQNMIYNQYLNVGKEYSHERFISRLETALEGLI